MKPIAWGFLVGLLGTGLLLPLGGLRATAQPPQGPAKPLAQQEPPQGQVSISVEVPVVPVEVIASTQHGDILTGLKKENFRIYEDGVPQTISNFSPTDAPITMVILLEFSRRGYYYYFGELGKVGAYDFVGHLNQKDWVALVTFDMKSRVEADFTQNKEEIKDAVNHLYFPGFSESNLFDALLDTVERLKEVKGKKSILLYATGVDTFSKHTLDQTLKLLRQSDVTIFSVGVAEDQVERMDASGQLGSIGRLGFYQAQNQLRTFAEITGGRAWIPRFLGEMPGIAQDIVASLRNQYSLAYIPANRVRDGKFRKIKVELVAPDGSPLTVLDQKKKKQKIVLYARQGYIAPKGNDLN